MEKAFYVFVYVRTHAVISVRVSDEDFVAVRYARYDWAGTEFFQLFNRLFRTLGGEGIGDTAQGAGLRDVGKDIIRLSAKRFHLFHVLRRKARVQFSAVAHDGIDDEYAVFHEKFAFDFLHRFQLRNAAQIAAVNEIEPYAEGLPMPQNTGNILRAVAEGVPRKPARVGGQDRRGQNATFDAAGGENGQRYRQGTFPDARYVVDCQNAHNFRPQKEKFNKSIINFLIFFVKRIKIDSVKIKNRARGVAKTKRRAKR